MILLNLIKTAETEGESLMRTVLASLSIAIILSILILTPALAQEGPDEIESNDTMVLSDFIDGFVIEGEIGADGDEDDWFVLDGQEGYYPTITLYYDNEVCDIDLDIWSDDQVIGSLSSVNSPDSGSFHVPDICYLHVYVYDGSGEYRIEIEPSDSSSLDRCEGDDEVESNNERDLADYIEEEDGSLEINGYACVDDEDWFMLDGTEGYNPTITLIYDYEICDIDLEIYSGDDYVGSLVDVESPDSDEFEVPDVCYLRVMAYDGEGQYTILIEP